jgi:iron uptake system EfeUOB component EfeO/EfeM
MPKSHHRAIGRLAVSAMLVAVTFLGACSSDDEPKAAGPTTTAPEQKVSTDAEVSAGLAKMSALVSDQVAAGPDTQKAAAARDELTTVWQSIEGTVKDKEPEIYVDIEDNMSLLSQGVEGDDDKGALGARDIITSMDDYLAKHPA